MFAYNIMKGGNTDSKAPEIQGFDYENVERYGSVDMKGGKSKKGKSKSKSSKFSDFDFEKEWKEFEKSYNQKYGGAKKKKTSSTKKKPAKKTSSTKKPAKKTSSTKKPKRKTQRGGDEAGATFAPAQMFDEKATMSAPSSDQSKGSLINGLSVHAPNNPVVAQTGGAKKKSSKAKKDTKKPKTATKTTKPKKDSKTTKPKKDSKKKDSKKDSKKTGKKESVLDKIKKFFAM